MVPFCGLLWLADTAAAIFAESLLVAVVPELALRKVLVVDVDVEVVLAVLVLADVVLACLVYVVPNLLHRVHAWALVFAVCEVGHAPAERVDALAVQRALVPICGLHFRGRFCGSLFPGFCAAESYAFSGDGGDCRA